MLKECVDYRLSRFIPKTGCAVGLIQGGGIPRGMLLRRLRASLGGCRAAPWLRALLVKLPWHGYDVGRVLLNRGCMQSNPYENRSIIELHSGNRCRRLLGPGRVLSAR